MKQTFLIAQLLLFCCSPLFSQFTIEKCGAEHLFRQYAQTHPEAETRRAELEAFTQDWITNQRQAQSRNTELYTIPVVVHIVYNNPEENISDRQVQSQIDILNEDFRSRNLNREAIPEEFRQRIADIGFEFCLASIDPNGQPTSGITRTTTSFDEIGNFRLSVDNRGVFRLFQTDLGGKDAWDPQQYLNVWIANTGNAFLGYGTRPGEFEPHQDGIVVDPRYFGDNCQIEPHHLGKTATHEVGHYFNLQHIWGSSTDCSSDDGVDDTPEQETNYRGCPTYPMSSCGSNDMFMNFMDYSDDACLAMFTEGQKLRMMAALNGPRKGLMTSNGCGLIRPAPAEKLVIYPNPAIGCIHIDLDTQLDYPATVRLIDGAGRMIYESVNYPSNILSINTDHLARGMYFVHVDIRGSTFVEKVIVSK